MVISHVKCIKKLSQRKFEAASQHQQNSMSILTKILQGIKEDNWPLPVLYVTARDMRLLAIAADKEVAHQLHRKSAKPNENLEKAAESLMAVFRVCATDIRTAPENSKRKAMMTIINQLFKIYFKINKLHLCKPLIRALENANMMDDFSKSERVTYKYVRGMKSMFDANYKAADELLTSAFVNCHPASKKNKRLILIFLIPVKILVGQFPKESALRKYKLEAFGPLVRAVKEGNLKGFDAALENEADFYWQFGIYLILEKLRIVVYRNVFKKVCLISKTHQVPISHLKAALEYLSGEGMELEEVHCILANLIFENKIKGYISLQHQILVISKANPFPPLATC
jgi:hypothetical protein